MNFDAIIKYQEIDNKRLKMMREFNKSPEVLKRAAAEKEFDDARTAVFKTDDDAAALYGDFDKITAELTAIEAEIDEYYSYIEGTKDIVEIEHYEKKVGELSDRMETLIRDLDRQGESGDKLDRTYKNATTEFLNAKKKLAAANAGIAALQQQIAPELSAIMQELKAAEPSVDPELLKLYKSKCGSVKPPVFVQYGEKGKFCRCGIEVPENVSSKLKAAGDMTSCPNCGRVLFIK